MIRPGSDPGLSLASGDQPCPPCSKPDSPQQLHPHLPSSLPPSCAPSPHQMVAWPLTLSSFVLALSQVLRFPRPEPQSRWPAVGTSMLLCTFLPALFCRPHPAGGHGRAGDEPSQGPREPACSLLGLGLPRQIGPREHRSQCPGPACWLVAALSLSLPPQSLMFCATHGAASRPPPSAPGTSGCKATGPTRLSPGQAPSP